jgi:general secretion pathway protein G
LGSEGGRKIASRGYRSSVSSQWPDAAGASTYLVPVAYGARRMFCRGFTLLELLVVIVIIGLLAGLVVPRYFDTVGKSKTKIVRAQMDAFEKALEQYRLDVGSLPTSEQGLQALNASPAGVTQWQGPYLKKAIPLDPWGHPYIYKLTSNRRDPEVVSLGADGQPGGSGEDKDVSLSSPD